MYSHRIWQFIAPQAVRSLPKHRDSNRHLPVTPSRQSLPLDWAYITLLLSLMLLAGLAGCGPASSDKSQNPGPRASVGAPSLPKQSPSSGNNPLTPVTQTASPVPLVSVINGEGSSPGTGTVPGEDKLPVPSIPDSIAKDIGSPDARARYRALDYWETKGTQAPLDPVFEAMEDEDEAVRAKATEIIERYWDAEHEGKRK